MTTTTENMHPKIAELARELHALTPAQLDKPTSIDRALVLRLRRRIRELAESQEISSNSTHQRDCGYLYVEGTRAANRQEAFYESNGHRYADEPAEQTA